jgi:hypothetical protein
MPETASWVIPTAYSLLGLKHISHASDEDLRLFRIRQGIEMLYDRICPEGGWNAGNGVVYGSVLTPHPDATAITLLALATEPANGFIDSSLDWLERSLPGCIAPWSDSWAVLALDAHRRPTESLIHRLCLNIQSARIDDCAALAVVSLAFRCAVGSNAFGASA